MAEVFEWGSRVVKLCRSSARKPTAFREAAIHAAVEAMALPVPAVWGVLEVGGRWGIVFDRVKERSFAERMRGGSERHTGVPAGARPAKCTHSRPAGPQLLGSLKSKLATNIAGTGLLDGPLKQILLGSPAGMPDGDRLCHGDFRLFAKAVAMECAAEGDGIRINTVHPGVIDTPIWTKISSSAGRNTPIDPNEVSKSGVPLGRVGQAQDIANGVLFLASDASSYMTGAELVIDGGMTGGAVRRWT